MSHTVKTIGFLEKKTKSIKWTRVSHAVKTMGFLKKIVPKVDVRVTHIVKTTGVHTQTVSSTGRPCHTNSQNIGS